MSDSIFAGGYIIPDTQTTMIYVFEIERDSYSIVKVEQVVDCPCQITSDGDSEYENKFRAIYLRNR